MKNLPVLLLIAGIGLLCSCKEKNNSINLIVGPKAFDTTYVTAAPVAQKRVLLAEEFTGATCPYCPGGRELLANIASQHPGQVIATELHLTTTPQSAPATSHGSKYDLRKQKAQDIFNMFYKAIDHIPMAGISRVPVNNEMAISIDRWADAVDKLSKTTSPVNVTISNNFDNSNNTAVIKVQVVYTQAVSQKQSLSIELLEDNIVDVQEFTDHYDLNYSFKNTFRDILTAASGDEFLSDLATKEPGRVYERTIILSNMDPAFRPENCRVVAFVHNNEATNKEVLQAAEAKLKQ